jgi:outer membrane protein OmpA-like peptidoglycan-associated protein
MKYLCKPMLLVLCMLVSVPAWSQIDLLKKAKKKTEKRVDDEADKKMDEGLDKLFGKKNKSTAGEATVQPAVAGSEASAPAETAGTDVDAATTAASPTGVLNWAKYDFVPGDKVIFEDNLEGEENGEFPSRWDLARGTAEVAEVDGENVIFLRGGNPTIVPYMKNSSEDYLPDVFTVEFDVYFGYSYMTMYLFDYKNQEHPKGSQDELTVGYNYLGVWQSTSKYPKDVSDKRWAHVAVAYTNGKFKAYLDDTRLVNVPRLDVNPTGISFYSYHASDNYPFYLKNIRIAEGGVKYYDRVMKDGKIIANGIRFDVGKATLKPESMGIINEVIDLMKEHPDLRFSVEGHTDSDGDDNSNLELSEKRAETVKSTMIGMGIAAERLESKGLGESMPITDNSSPEGKANNRRVEFVKL